MKVWPLIISVAFSLPAGAEYRAYRLTITNQTTGAQRTVISNFDHIQYRDLYPVLQEEEVILVNSWMCYGDTSQKPVCDEPDPEFSETIPKSDLN